MIVLMSFWAMIVGLVALISVSSFADLGNQLLMFIAVGKLPFLPITIPATIMLIFWISLLPFTIMLIKGSDQLFWSLIEKIGEINQLKINRKVRLFVPIKTSSYQDLVTITLLNVDTKHQKPELSVRRRFAALPA